MDSNEDMHATLNLCVCVCVLIHFVLPCYFFSYLHLYYKELILYWIYNGY